MNFDNYVFQPQTYRSKCDNNPFFYREANSKIENEEEKVAIPKGESEAEIHFLNETNLSRGDLVPKAKPSESKNTYLVMRVPYMSRIEIPNPDQLAAHYKALGYAENMIRRYQLNIKLTFPRLRGSLLGLVSRKEKFSADLLEKI